MSTMQTFMAAKGVCQSLGMQLYAATTTAEFTALNNALQAKFGQGNGASLWLDGIQDTDGSWYVYNPSKTPLATSAIPASAYNATAPCLFLSNTPGPFMPTTNNCAGQTSYFNCEYILAQPTTTTSTTTTTAAPTTTTTSN